MRNERNVVLKRSCCEEKKIEYDEAAIQFIESLSLSLSQKRIGIVQAVARVVHGGRDIDVGRFSSRRQVAGDARVRRQISCILVIWQEQVVFLAFVLGPDGAGLEEVVDLVAVDERALHVLQRLHDQGLRAGWAHLNKKNVSTFNNRKLIFNSKKFAFLICTCHVRSNYNSNVHLANKKKSILYVK